MSVLNAKERLQFPFVVIAVDSEDDIDFEVCNCVILYSFNGTVRERHEPGFRQMQRKYQRLGGPILASKALPEPAARLLYKSPPIKQRRFTRRAMMRSYAQSGASTRTR